MQCINHARSKRHRESSISLIVVNVADQRYCCCRIRSDELLSLSIDLHLVLVGLLREPYRCAYNVLRCSPCIMASFTGGSAAEAWQNGS
jgi:hypothetical protein